MQRFDKCPFMALTYVGFLMDIQDNPQSGHSHLQAARKLEPSLVQVRECFWIQLGPARTGFWDVGVELGQLSRQCIFG